MGGRAPVVEGEKEEGEAEERSEYLRRRRSFPL